MKKYRVFINMLYEITPHRFFIFVEVIITLGIFRHHLIVQ